MACCVWIRLKFTFELKLFGEIAYNGATEIKPWFLASNNLKVWSRFISKLLSKFIIFIHRLKAYKICFPNIIWFMGPMDGDLTLIYLQTQAIWVKRAENRENCGSLPPMTLRFLHFLHQFLSFECWFWIIHQFNPSEIICDGSVAIPHF